MLPSPEAFELRASQEHRAARTAIHGSAAVQFLPGEESLEMFGWICTLQVASLVPGI